MHLVNFEAVNYFCDHFQDMRQDSGHEVNIAFPSSKQPEFCLENDYIIVTEHKLRANHLNSVL